MPKTKKAAPIKHFVVSEADGPFITTTPAATDVILCETHDLAEAERVLCRACEDHEADLDEDDDMNEDFR